MKVLAAEDDTTSRVILESLLQRWGHDVISVDDGRKAWDVLRAPNAPRLAILDWMMPAMDGVEICHRARRELKDEPPYIILLTALGRKEDIVAGLRAGASDYVTKPFDREELRARVDVGRQVIELQDELKQKVFTLEKALSHIRTLQGILPICMHCHKIRNDEESWQRIESYIEAHSDAQFSHSLCPECLDKYYPEQGGTAAPAEDEPSRR